MEFDENFNENPHFHQSFSLEKHLEPKMENGFLFGSSPSKGMYQNFPYLDRFTDIENSSSNASFGVLTPFYDPFDPFQASSTSECASLFNLSESKNPFGSLGANLPMHSKPGFLSYSPKILLQALNEDQNYPQPNYQQFGLSNANSSEGVSCLTVEEHKHQAQSDSKKKKTVQPKGSKNAHHNPLFVKGNWTPEEDRLLLDLVEQFGERRWSHIAEMLNGRMGKQCRERWHNHLRPNIKKDIWTEEEEMMLIEAHRQVGNKWAAIARKMPGRTENTIKNHWNATKRRRRFTTKRKGKKYNSILHEYILSLTPPDQGPDLDDKNQTAPNRDDPDHNKAMGFGFDGMPSCGSVGDESNNNIVDKEVEFGVKREMDLLEMVYQGII